MGNPRPHLDFRLVKIFLVVAAPKCRQLTKAGYYNNSLGNQLVRKFNVWDRSKENSKHGTCSKDGTP